MLGSYPDFGALQAGLRGGERRLHAAVVDAEDPAAGPRAVDSAEAGLSGAEDSAAVRGPLRRRSCCALEERVEGVVLKSDTAEEVILALNVLEGRAVMPAGWHEALLEREAVARVLSVREREVLDLAASGLSNKEIAERLVISVNTVKFHLRGVYRSLGVRNRLQASQAMSQVTGSPPVAQSSVPIRK